MSARAVMVGNADIDKMLEAEEGNSELGKDVVMLLRFDSQQALLDALREGTVSFRSVGDD